MSVGRADRRGAVFAGVATLIAALLIVQVVARVAPWFSAPSALAAKLPTPAANPAETAAPVASLAALLRPEVAELHQQAAADDPAPERRAALSGRCEDPRIAGWVQDLRDDDVRWNATTAVGGLLELPAGEIVELEQALGSADPQQRHTAAGVLRDRCRRHGQAPSEALLQVLVDGLSSRVTTDTRWLTGPMLHCNLDFLVEHTVAARRVLARALAVGDQQQRFFCAYLLACARLPEADAWAVRQLVEHLGDNRIGGDALMATHALYRLGEPALAQLAEMRNHTDRQGQRLVDLILLDLRDPPRDVAALRARRALHDISGVYHDPAIEYQLGRSSLPRFSGW